MLSVFVFASLPARGKPADNPFSIINSSLREALTARIPTDKSLPFIFLFLHSAFVILFPAVACLPIFSNSSPNEAYLRSVMTFCSTHTRKSICNMR